MSVITDVIRIIFIIFLMVASPISADANKSNYSIYDGHIHYDQDVWGTLPPDEAIEMLKSQNIQRALVSATPTEGAEMLYRENSEVVVPMLRPYKNIRHRYLWFKDPELKAYLMQHLERVPYRGFGEFHVFAEDADTKPVEEMIRLARERGLVLHPHTRLPGMRILLEKSPDIVVLWAHGGFDVPVDTLRKLMDEYPKLYIELSLREGMLDADEKLTQQWKVFLTNYRSRFLVGMDTYKPSRWADLPEIAAETRHWLNQLPADVVDDIARNNFDRLFPKN